MQFVVEFDPETKSLNVASPTEQKHLGQMVMKAVATVLEAYYTPPPEAAPAVEAAPSGFLNTLPMPAHRLNGSK